MMKTKILSFLFLMGIVLIGTNAFADDETSVSIGSTITYNVSATTGTPDTDGYVWTVSAGGSIQSGQGSSQITVLWNSEGAQTVSVQMTDSNGCLSEPQTLNITVNDSNWNLTNEDNTTTCSLLSLPSSGTSGNNQDNMNTPQTLLPDNTTFEVAITNPISGQYDVEYTVSDGNTTQTYTVTDYDETTPGTITIGHADDANLIAYFTNGTSNPKPITITVTSVTDPNGSTVTYGGTKNSYTVTVNPKPVITFN